MAAPSKAVCVFLFHKEKLFAVKNEKGELGAPGGKLEPEDATWEAGLKREFKEETGQELQDEYIDKFFDYHNDQTNMDIRVYYTVLDEAQASTFNDQKVEDPACEEVEVLWTFWKSSTLNFRAYTRKDLDWYLDNILKPSPRGSDPLCLARAGLMQEAGFIGPERWFQLVKSPILRETP